MEFEGIWYNMDGEVKRDRVIAKDSTDASAKIHALYAGRAEPAECLSVVSASGMIPPQVDLNGGTFL